MSKDKKGNDLCSKGFGIRDYYYYAPLWYVNYVTSLPRELGASLPPPPQNPNHSYSCPFSSLRIRTNIFTVYHVRVMSLFHTILPHFS